MLSTGQKRQEVGGLAIPTTAGSSVQNLEAKSVGLHVARLLLVMLPIVLLSKMPAVYVDFIIAELGAPVALGGFLVAAMILTHDVLAALDFARVNQLQRAVNICFGSAVATIGLIMPAVLVASTMVGLPIELGLEPAEIALLALTLAISIVTFVGTRTNSLQGLYTWQPS